jgi:hypothetical protein
MKIIKTKNNLQVIFFLSTPLQYCEQRKERGEKYKKVEILGEAQLKFLNRHYVT